MKRRLASVAATAVLAIGCAPDPSAVAVGLVVTGCRPGEEIGSGIVVSPGLVLTSAHVVAGARTITVHHRNGTTAGRVVGFDPDMDLAYLAVDAPELAIGPSIEIDSARIGRGRTAIAYVFRDREITTIPVTVRRRVRINTEDVYVEGETRRPGFELGADIRAGDSGGPVIVDGRIVAVIWARSRRAADRAWAVDPDLGGDRIRDQLATGELGDDIDLGRCS